MQKFPGIEGLRAWLAWVVVGAHLFAFSGVQKFFPGMFGYLGRAADVSVQIFIIISGFVITHLIIASNEPYKAYIVRRFFRIYPVYLLALCLGIAGTYAGFDTFSGSPWGELSPSFDRMQKQLASLAGYGFWTHIAAHLTLLHGAISNNVLYESQYMFLAPAWSLSLEWQFYLLAPFIVLLARSSLGSIFLALATVLLYFLYRRGSMGSFILPSVLPGAALYFAIGIITRLCFTSMNGVSKYPFGASIILFAFLPKEWTPVAIWVFFFWASKVEANNSDFLSSRLRKIFNLAFNSPLANKLGQLSYSTYIVHVPVIQIFTWLAVKRLAMGPTETIVSVTIFSIPFVVLISHTLNRFIEIPGIALGKKLAYGHIQKLRPTMAN